MGAGTAVVGDPDLLDTGRGIAHDLDEPDIAALGSGPDSGDLGGADRAGVAEESITAV
jgi:hypothetical protein